VRLAVYSDYRYHRAGDALYAEIEFALFVDALASRMEVVLVGRLDPSPASGRYEITRQAGFLALPYYPSMSRPLRALRRMVPALGRFWRALDDLDAVWLLGPHPLAVAFAAIAALRRRRVILGVRQDYVRYVRARYPRRPLMWTTAVLLEGAYLGIARLAPTVVVGPALSRRYRRARRLIQMGVSLVRGGDLVTPEAATRRSYDGPLTLLSVGRLDREKNPLILAEVLAMLRSEDPRWQLVVCGDGPMEAELRARLDALGLLAHAELRGFVPHGRLAEIYRGSHAFLHTSWTEGGGPPQVLVEAFAAGAPVVATNVGGVREVADAVRLVPPGDAAAAAAELRRVATDPHLRRQLIESGIRYAAANTLESKVDRLALFLRS
jgi:glycosyltransferase involved in cell wall biosynthesis